MTLAETVAEKVEAQSSYWDELIKSGDVTQEQADRLIALTQENRLTFDGFRTHTNEGTGEYGIFCQIFYDPEYNAEKPLSLRERRIIVYQVGYWLDSKEKDHSKPTRVPVSTKRKIPREITDFLVKGLKLTPNHWNSHSMALFQSSYRQFTAKEEYNIQTYGNPEGPRR